jgi:hypothetical protein
MELASRLVPATTMWRNLLQRLISLPARLDWLSLPPGPIPKMENLAGRREVVLF